MKKFLYLFAFLTLVTFTSCNSDDDDLNKQTFTATINTRAIDGDDVVFSQSTANAELNYTDNTIQFNYEFKDINGQAHSINTPAMPMSIASSTVYAFTAPASSTTTGVEGLTGFMDLGTGMLWFTFTLDGSTTVVSSSHLLYAYSTTVIDNGQYSHTQSAYLFALNAQGTSATMQINNFIADTNGAIQASYIQYEGLTVTPTTTGYTIVASEVESSYKEYYTITDVNITLNDQCRYFNGSFKCNGHEFKISGPLYE